MKHLLTGLVCILAVLTTSCKKEESQPVDSGKTAAVSVHLTDGPAHYEALFIDVKQIEIQHKTQGTLTLPLLHPGVYNLLDFRNGIDLLLSQGQLPLGKLSQIRLILGENNSVKINGVTYPLSAPSAEESGLKLMLQEDLQANTAYDFWIDMDAARSVVKTAEGKYILKPVLHAYSGTSDGRIKGSVAPLPPGTTAYAINGIDTFSAIPSAAGFFMFCGLPEGKYTVRLEAETATAIEVKNVNVHFGAVTDLGILSLLP